MSLIENQNPPEIKPIFLSKVMQQLDQHTYLITATQRLSRFRLQQYETIQIQQGSQAWHTPHILTWHTWLQEQWGNASQSVLLNPQQERLLWQKAILEDEHIQVLNPKALAKQAMEAWGIIADYHIDPTCLTQGGEEHTALWRWADKVNQHVSKLPASSKYFQKHQQLSELSNNNPYNTVKTIILDGFDTFSPAQITYLQALQQKQHHIYQIIPDTPLAHTSLSSYQDDEEEMRQTCQAIRQYVAQYPQHTVGVLMPNLEQHAAQISRIFSEELAPALSLESQTEQQGDYFNISMGSPLAKQPMIQSAFTILSLTSKPSFSYQDITQLLLCPYVMGYAQEIHQRAQLDADFRAANHDQTTALQLYQLSQQTTLPLPLWQSFIQYLHEQSTDQKRFHGKKRLSAWMLTAEGVLKELTWHEQAISGYETAQVQNWRTLIDQLSCLDDFCDLLSWSEALSRLQEQAFEQPFRPAPGQANIQIMGVLEAVGLQFDHAFVLGMDDQTWPPAAKPHPLIPVDIQIQYQTPHANNEREWVFSQSVWQHLLHTSPTLTISYAKTRDQQDVQASSVLQDTPQVLPNPLISNRYATTLQQQPAHLETIAEQPMPVATEENIRGGTSILANQAACAFKAFAQHRLQLKSIETPTLGLNPAEQGSLLHAALEQFWKQVHTHHHLLKLQTDDTLSATIQACITQAWASIEYHISQEIKQLESQRLHHLLYRWLMLESQRTPFQVVEKESKREVSFGQKSPLKLRTRIDRIDQDVAGNRIIIDYKTGRCEAKEALGERPDSPQLPAYLIAEKALGVDVAGLVYAQVRSDELNFKGFLRENTTLPNFKTAKNQSNTLEHWQELVQTWQDTLDDLADAFMAGQADIRPKNTLSCRYCEFSGLCRIENQGQR